MKSDLAKKRVIVIGGGASGLLAAITAAKEGASVTILEQNEKPGKKLNATGNGHCNLTNLSISEDSYRGSHPEFASSALNQFSVQDTLAFFTEIGASPISKNGYIYPRSGQAAQVTELLLRKARSLGVKIKTKEKVCTLLKESGTGSAWLVKTLGWQYEADSVILAAGSKASAIQGSDGSGYALAKDLGHPIISPFPALCALRLMGDRKLFSAWAGVRTEGTVSLWTKVQRADQKKTPSRTNLVNDSEMPVCQAGGELQLTDYGISGIPVFQVSRYAVQALQEGKTVTLSIDFLPEIKEEEAEPFLQERQRLAPYQDAGRGEHLLGCFPDKLVRVLSRENDLVHAIKHFSFQVLGGMDFKQAQVCAGGIDTTQVNPETMESLLHKGLYFAGEVLDIDGTCGGYNLQWAWSSGYTAGKHAAI